MGCINDNSVCSSFKEGFSSFKGIGCHAHRTSDQETAKFILGCIWKLNHFLNVLDGNQARQSAVIIHQRQFFDAVFMEDALRCFKVCSNRGCYQVVTGHVLRNQRLKIRDKAHVAIGDNPHQLAIFQGLHNRNPRDAVALHQFFCLMNLVIWSQEEGINNNPIFRTFYLAHFFSLLGHRHVFMDNTQASCTCNGNGHLAVCDCIHGRGDNRNIQCQILSQLSL